MNLNHLLYFRALARLQHFGKAAKELYVSQPNLSYAIATLEQSLGIKLFEKRGRNVELTKYGQIFAQTVEKSLTELDNGTGKLQKLISSQYGHIDIAFFHSLGVKLVPNLMNNFVSQKKHRGITFSLYQYNTLQTVAGLRDGHIDLGFCSYLDRKEYADIEIIAIAQQAIHFIVPKNHYLAQQKSISLNEIAKHPFIAFKQNSGLRPVIDEILNRFYIQPNITYEVPDGNHVAGFVAAGLGISIIPDVPLPNLDICTIPITEHIQPRLVYLATLKDAYLSDAALAFKKYIIEKCIDLLI